MHGALILFILSFLCFLVGWLFWDMDDTVQPFWVSLLDALSDIFMDFVPGVRSVALILWFIGLIFLLFGIGAL
ncbi:hypothetical protein [Ectobacillus funiculus]|uniref:Uncharacterized protein n=1 Tax=Ectobacillus funiculus TaxID=137993 RepID=A0ABV5WFG9_9BACI